MHSTRNFKLPVLLYHSILDSGCDDTAVSQVQFNSHIQLIHDLEFQTYRIEQLLDLYSMGSEVPDNAISIHFDDGYEDTFSLAAPILEMRSFTATIFVITQSLGEMNLWDRRVDRLLRHMTSGQLCNLLERGFEIGAHTRTHHNLEKFGEVELDKELEACKDELEKLFHLQVSAFSYPYGKYNQKVKSLAQKHFKIAFSVSEGSDNWHEDLFALKRFKLSRHTKDSELLAFLLSYKHAET